MISRLATLLLSTALLAAHTATAEAVSTASQQSSQRTNVTAVAQNQTVGELPEAIADRVKAELASDLNIPTSQLRIDRYSRETWSDGCLGLGGPAESCLAALTEGWQIEVVNVETEQSYFYRTDLSGDQIRLSDEDQSLPPSVSAPQSFSDVSSDYWASDYIQRLAALGIVSGFPDGTFRPDAPVTRAEFAAILRQAFLPAQATGTTPSFRDVPADYWAAEAIQAARATNFLSGYPGNVFYPQRNLSRVQAIVSLASGLGYETVDTGVLDYYIDAREIPEYALTQVSGATEAGVVVSYRDLTQLNPNQTASRADVAAFVYQSLVQQGKADPLATPPYAVNPTASNWQTQPSAVIPTQDNSDISLSASGLRLLTVKPDMLQVWDAENGDRLSEIVTDGETRFVSAAINGAGTQVAAVVHNLDNQALQLRLWNVETGEPVWNQSLGTPTYASQQAGAALVDSPYALVTFTRADDALLTQVVLEFDADNAPTKTSLRLHNSDTGRLVQTLDPASGVGISKYSLGQNGALLAGVSTVQDEQTTREVIDIWQLNTGALLRSITPIEDNSFGLNDLAFNPSENLIVFSQDYYGYDVHLDTWDVRSGERLARITSLPDIDRQDRIGRLSPAGDYYFARSDVAGTRLIDLNRRTVTAFDVVADSVVFGGNGNRLAIATPENIQLFNQAERL